MTARLREKYRKEVVPQLVAERGYHSPMQVPRLEKVVLNIGLGEAVQNPKALESAAKDLAAISGQKPVITRAKQSIAGFKVRAGVQIGLKVTLRRERMFHFLDKLFHAVLPRSRDFRGVARASFDGQGNYHLGLREQLLFPEIDYMVDKMRGLQVTVVTTARNKEEAERMLGLLGMPFAKEG